MSETSRSGKIFSYKLKRRSWVLNTALPFNLYWGTNRITNARRETRFMPRPIAISQLNKTLIKKTEMMKLIARGIVLSISWSATISTPNWISTLLDWKQNFCLPSTTNCSNEREWGEVLHWRSSFFDGKYMINSTPSPPLLYKIYSFLSRKPRVFCANVFIICFED